MKSVCFASVALVLTLAMPAVAADAAKGEKVFRKCKACHQVGDGAEARTGPVLNGIIGRAAAATEFGYSKAMADAGADGLVWTEEALAAFLTKPKDYMSGTKMAFPGLRKDSERADVIAYLATFQ